MPADLASTSRRKCWSPHFVSHFHTSTTRQGGHSMLTSADADAAHSHPYRAALSWPNGWMVGQRLRLCLRPDGCSPAPACSRVHELPATLQLISNPPTVLQSACSRPNALRGFDCCSSAQAHTPHSTAHHATRDCAACSSAPHRKRSRVPGNIVLTPSCCLHGRRQQDQAMPQAVRTRTPHRVNIPTHPCS
jgi:hypothetical protein